MKLAHNYYVYIICCSDQSYYIGVTNDLDRRVVEHNEGFNPHCYTFKRRPILLKYFEQYTDVNEAIRREKQLKGWSRAKKEALFLEDFDLISQLAKAKTSEK